MSGSRTQRPLKGLLGGIGLLLVLLTTGCAVQVGGQTLPSPNYLTDDVQYFAPGPEFKLEREAAAQQAAQAEAFRQQRP
jgi:hypothetical protein